MSHRTAATALLLASLPYGIALPQVIPFLSEFAPDVTPLPLPPVPAVNASTVTVVGTIVQDAVDSAVESITDAIEDAVDTAVAVLESATDAFDDVLPTDVPSILDPEADILPLILPGVLPVETDLPPVDAPDVDAPEVDADADAPDAVASILPAFDLDLDAPDAVMSILPFFDVDFPGDDLPDTNDLEVIDLPAPTEVPYGDDGLIAEPFPFIPDFPDFPDEANVPISTFNAVVQPLLSVIQTLLNSLPGNTTPPLPDIFVDPLLPTETPDIFTDPILPTETLDETVPSATDVFDDPLFDLLVDPIPSRPVLGPRPIPLSKRQAAVPLTTQGIFDLVASILTAINALVQQIPVAGPIVAEIVDNVADSVLDVPDVPDVPAVPVDVPAVPVDVPAAPVDVPAVPVDVPAVPVDTPALPVSNITLPSLQPPSPPLSEALPTELPVDVPDITAPEPAAPEVPSTLPAPLDLPANPLSESPADVPDVTAPEVPSTLPAPLDLPADPLSEIPDEVWNLPFPDDIEGIDWASFESPPFSDLPAPSGDEPAIPDDVLNVPVPDLDENGVPIDAPVESVSSVVTAAPAALPTSLDAFGDFFDDLVDWPFADIPDTVAPDATGELPDLNDLPTSDDVQNVPVPELDDGGVPVDLPTDAVDGLLLPIAAPTLALPTYLIAAAPTDLLDVPVPEGFEDVGDLPEPTVIATALPAVPTDDFADIPADVLNIPWPELDENGIPIDIPIQPSTAVFVAPAALPTDLSFLDIPVPDDIFDDLDEVPAPPAPSAVVPDVSDLPIPDDILNIPVPDLNEDGVPIDLPAPALPDEAFGAGFPIQALPDVPLVLPTDDLLPVEGAAALTEAVSAVSTDAISGLPTSVVSDGVAAVPTLALVLPYSPPQIPTPPLPSVAASTDVTSDLPTSVVSDGVPAVPTLAVVLPYRPPQIPASPLPSVDAISVPAPVVSADPVVATLPAVPVVAAPAPAAPVVVPRLPFQVPSGPRPLGPRPLEPRPLGPRPLDSRPLSSRPLEKRQLATLLAQIKPPAVKPLPINTPAVVLVKPVFDLISTLLAKLGVDAEKVPNLAAALSLAPPLPPVPVIPTFPGLPDVSEVIDTIASSLPIPDIASILRPVPLVLPNASDLGTILPAVTSLPTVSDVASIVDDALSEITSALPVPVVPDVVPAAPVVPVVPSPAVAVAPVASVVGGTRRARRAIEESQQGPASDWESFLGELDESYQSELTGLIHDSAKAVNNDDLDSLADALKSDFEDLSDSTKAQLISGFASGPVLATALAKRAMRHGKPQAIPGAQSIGPNLDDARKVDLTSILGKTGTLDPYGQASQSQAIQGQPADAPEPEGFPAPSQSDSFSQLPYSFVASSPNAELAAILAAGGLDPNGMLNPVGDTLNDPAIEDPYADIRKPWDTALDASQPAQALEGLPETIQASESNHIGNKGPRISLANTPSYSSVMSASQDENQRNVLIWFHRNVRPSWNKDVDPEIDFS